MHYSSEKSPLLRSTTPSEISSQDDSTKSEKHSERARHDYANRGQQPDRPEYHIQVYRRRWYMLAILTLISFLQNYLTITWQVIAVSVRPVFDWTNAEISLMLNWNSFMYILFIFPMSWLTEARGKL